MAKVSVIVPVYNVEKYLGECIDSVLAQTYNDWELLLVDDGSTDDSGKICDRYAADDERINVIHKKNAGVAAARNTALDRVKSEYVMFLDPDDYWLDNRTLEYMLAKAEETGADIVRGDYRAVDERGETLFERPVNDKKQVCIGKKLSPAEFVTQVVQWEFFLWLLLFKHSVIEAERFNEGQVFLEDMDFYSRLMLKPVVATYIPFRFYAYRKTGTSVSSTISLNRLRDSFGMCRRFADYALCASDICLKRYFQKSSVMLYYRTLGTLSGDACYPDRKNIIEALGLAGLHSEVRRNMLRHKLFDKSFPFVLLPPVGGVWLLRLKNKVLRKIYSSFRNS